MFSQGPEIIHKLVYSFEYILFIKIYSFISNLIIFRIVAFLLWLLRHCLVLLPLVDFSTLPTTEVRSELSYSFF